MGTGLIILIVVIILVVIAVAVAIGMYNGLVRMRNNAREAWAQIDTQLQRRADLIPNLVETVKGYAKHESETLQRVTDARVAAQRAHETGEVADAKTAETAYKDAMVRVNAVAEQYPDLKASQNFLSL